jgi:hypothetical protein
MVLNLLATTVEENMIHFEFQGIHNIKIKFPHGYERDREGKRERENCVI